MDEINEQTEHKANLRSSVDDVIFFSILCRLYLQFCLVYVDDGHVSSRVSNRSRSFFSQSLLLECFCCTGWAGDQVGRTRMCQTCSLQCTIYSTRAIYSKSHDTLCLLAREYSRLPLMHPLYVLLDMSAPLPCLQPRENIFLWGGEEN